MKRVLGVAALGGGLLALSAGAASAQEVAADVRVCADGRVLSGLLGSCSGSGTTASVRAGRSDGSTGVRVRARVPRTAEADVSVGTRRSRPAASASGQAATSRPRSIRADADVSAVTSPRPRADASASLTRRARPLLDLDATVSLAGVGLLGSSPFTLVGDPATDNLLPTGELTLDGLTGEAPAGIGVLDSTPIASGNQVGLDVGDVSPSVPVTVCGNGVGVLGDASASCTPAAPTGSSSGSTGSGSTGASAGSGSASSDSLLGSLASGNQVDAGIGDISPSVPVTVCGNGVGVLGDASAACGAGQQAGTGGSSSGSAGSGSTGASAGTGSLLDGTASGNQVDAGIGSISPSAPVTVCGNSVGGLGDASASCGTAAPAASNGGSSAGASGSADVDGTLAGNQAEVTIDDVAANVPLTVCGNSVGLLGDASSSCGTGTTTSGTETGTIIDVGTVTGTDTTADVDMSIGTFGVGTGTDTSTGTDTGTGIGTDTGIGVDIGVNTGTDTSTGGIIAPPPGTTSPGGTDGPGSSTGTSGVPGTQGLTPGSGGADGSVTTSAPLRPAVAGAGSGALPFTGAAGDLLALVAFALLAAGALVVRATGPAAAPEGGDDR